MGSQNKLHFSFRGEIQGQGLKSFGLKQSYCVLVIFVFTVDSPKIAWSCNKLKSLFMVLAGSLIIG